MTGLRVVEFELRTWGGGAAIQRNLSAPESPVEFLGRLYSTPAQGQPAAAGSQGGTAPAASPSATSGKLVCNRSGLVVYSDCRSDLPLLLANQSAIGFLRLAPRSERSWRIVEPVEAVLIPLLHVGGYLDPRGVFQSLNVAALRVGSCSRKSGNDMQREYGVLVLNPQTEEPVLVVKTNDTIRIDGQTGLIESMTQKGMFVHGLNRGETRGNLEVRIGKLPADAPGILAQIEKRRDEMVAESSRRAEETAQRIEEERAAIYRDLDSRLAPALSHFDPDR